LTLGGTGKTPLVKWIARWGAARGIRAAIVSRGYGASQDQPNDEARELAQALPGVPHVQDPDRVSAAQRAVAEFAVQLIILDDGFQHRRLGRDLDIVLLDALEPFGFDHVFPRGTLREPVASLARADIVCLSRADLVTLDQRQAIRERVRRLSPQAVWCEVVHAPSGTINATGQQLPLDALRGRRVAAFCGLGNPAGFRRTLEAVGCQVVAWREFPDHHSYTGEDSDALHQLADEVNAEILVCTHKDLVKIERNELGHRPLWAVAVDMEFLSGRGEVEAALAQVCGPQ
jgi:tetraacyldisaccharide 4'-kinase